MDQLQFRITNLTCEACVAMCTLLIKRLPGVKNVSIDRSSGMATVDASPPLTLDVVGQTLRKEKYTVAEAV